VARIEGLREEVKEVFKGKTKAIEMMYHAKKYFYVVGVVSGLALGVFFKSSELFFISAIVISLALYLYGEQYLLNQDHAFFTSKGCSKREIFDRYYAKEVSRGLSLQMTEPESLVSGIDTPLEEQRKAFKQREAIRLEEEFKRSDWKYFVAEVLIFQK
jgi:hypothetical protein